MSRSVDNLNANFSAKVSPRAVIVALAGLLVLLAVNWSIMQREHLLREGQLVLLELAPVDPRSLMQGDYMALRFKITDEAFPNSRWGLRSRQDGAAEPEFPVDGHLVVTVDEHGVGQIKFATNGYFFEEGQAQTYEQARYGAFRVAENGDMILTAMHGLDYALLKNKIKQDNT